MNSSSHEPTLTVASLGAAAAGRSAVIPARWTSRTGMLGLVLLLALAAGCLAYLYHVATTTRAQFPLHGDETFFALCAARGAATGQWLMPGCQDNKGPVIYTVYRVLGAIGRAPYDMAVFKAAALTLFLLTVFTMAALVKRVSGIGAAAFGVFVCVVSVSANPVTLVLNTELLGTSFAVLSLAALMLLRVPLPGRALAAGVCVGFAAMTKQPFGIFLLPVLGWLWFRHRTASPRLRVVNCLLACVGAVLPGVVFALYFGASGGLLDFVGSVFIYPLSYGQSVDGSRLRSLFYRLYGMASIVDRTALLGLVFAVAVVAGGWAKASRREAGARDGVGYDPAFYWFAIASLALVAVAPVLDIRVAAPFFVFAAFAGAVAVTELMRSVSDDGVAASAVLRAFTAVACVFSVVGLFNVWFNNGPVRDGDQSFDLDRLPQLSGRVGYVFGIWPQFYFFNKLVPASDVLYATAFAGSVKSPMAASARKGSFVDTWMQDAYRRNEQHLMRDFARTPPAYVVIGSSEATDAGRLAKSGVAALDRYVDEHCRFMRPLTPPRLMTSSYAAMSLYACGA